jgi:hypothetical protein
VIYGSLSGMNLRRICRYLFLPLAFVLLFAQQAGAAHALGHALDDIKQHQEDKHTPHSNACEKCADYAQLGNALGVAALDFIPPRMHGTILPGIAVVSRSFRVLAAAARGPPSLLQNII